MLSGQTSVYIDTIKSDTENNTLISAVNMDVATDVKDDVDVNVDQDEEETEGKKKKELDRSTYGKYIMRFGKNFGSNSSVLALSREGDSSWITKRSET